MACEVKAQGLRGRRISARTMSPAYKPAPAKPFLKGLMASSDPYSQPPGTFPRGSNMLLNKRGALDVCDGTQLIHAFNGAVQSGRGKVTCTFLFSPTGVSRYYLAIIKAFDIPLGAPQNFTVLTAAGGTLAAATYFYKVTALDGVGGETTASNEVSQVTPLNNKNMLTWNIVPNATQYNVYRSTSSGTEVLLTSSNLPVAQAATGALTFSYVDDGTASAPSIAIASATSNSFGNVATFQTVAPNNLANGQAIVVSGSSQPGYNGTFSIQGIIDATHFTVR